MWSFELRIFSGAGFVGATQIPQCAMEVVENDANLVDMHLGFSERDQDHEFFCHVNEATSFQPDALNQSRFFSSVHAFEHEDFPSFHVHQSF